MLFVLYDSPEFAHLDEKKRKRAAQRAQARAMRHWQFWLGACSAIPAGIIFSVLDRRISGIGDGVFGGLFGFFLGTLAYARALYIIGMPYYRRILFEEEIGLASTPGDTNSGE